MECLFFCSPAVNLIEQLGADESPLSSLDHGLGERIPDHGQQNTTIPNDDNNGGSNMQVDGPKSDTHEKGMQMVNMHNTIGIGLAGTPTEGNVPLLQVSGKTATLLSVGGAPTCVSLQWVGDVGAWA